MSLYETGTITGALNSTTISGTGTKWSDAKIGITNGSVLFVSSSAGMDGVYQAKRVINDTSIELAQPIYKAFTHSKYSILVAEASSTASFANQLAAALGYYQAQIDGWQQIMTGTGEVELTAPDGTKVTIKSFTALDKDKMSVGAFGLGLKKDSLPDSLNGASGFFGAGSYAVGKSAAVAIQSSYGSERRGQFSINMANEAYFRFCNTASDDPTTHPWKQLVAVGDYGIGAKNPPIIENSVIAPTGFYSALTDKNELGKAFGIAGQAVGIINLGMHHSESEKFKSQIGTSYSSGGRMFLRCSLDSAWKAWREVYCSGATNAKFGSGFSVENEASGGYIVFNVVNNARPITDNGCKFAIEIPNSTERPYMLQRKNDGTTTGQIVNQLPVSSGQIAIQGTSGREYKKDVVDADGTEALNRINKLRLVNYIYIDDEKGRLRFGFIAEEAEIIAPQYIKHMQEPIDEIVDPDSGEVIDRIYRDRPCVDNNPIVMDLLGAIQVLTSKVNEQETRLLALEKQHPIDK